MSSILAQTDNPWAGIDVAYHLRLFAPLISMVVTMLAVVAAPMIIGRKARRIGAIAMAGTVATLLLTIQTAVLVHDGGGAEGLSTSVGSALLLADNLSVFFQIVVTVFILGVSALWWMGSADSERNAPEFFILLLGSALGMMLMVSTGNLLMIVIAIETASLPSYALVGFDKRSGKGAEASLKYAVFGAISAAIMLYGVSLLYGLSGSLEASVVAQQVYSSITDAVVRGESAALAYVGMFCLLAGIAFKISAVPFHFWCPDAFEGAKIEVTTWLSVVSKAAGLLLLMRLVLLVCDTAGGDAPGVSTEQRFNLLAPMWYAIGWLAAITCTFGNLAAYRQKSVKRLLAYSSIAHAGYMMMAMAVFLFPLIKADDGTVFYRNHPALSALFVYIMTYMFMNFGAFGVTAMVVWQTGSDELSAFTGLARRSLWLALPMVICLVSLVGLPPLAGFLAKWWLLAALGEMGGVIGWALVVVLCLNTLISLFYYMRVVVQMTLRDDDAAQMSPPVPGLAMVNVCALMLFLMFVFARPVKSTADYFASHLYRLAWTSALVVDAEDQHDAPPDAADGSPDVRTVSDRAADPQRQATAADLNDEQRMATESSSW